MIFISKDCRLILAETKKLIDNNTYGTYESPVMDMGSIGGWGVTPNCHDSNSK
jgi:hypothetical protein